MNEPEADPDKCIACDKPFYAVGLLMCDDCIDKLDQIEAPFPSDVLREAFVREATRLQAFYAARYPQVTTMVDLSSEATVSNDIIIAIGFVVAHLENYNELSFLAEVTRFSLSYALVEFFHVDPSRYGALGEGVVRGLAMINALAPEKDPPMPQREV